MRLLSHLIPYEDGIDLSPDFVFNSAILISFYEGIMKKRW